jgi:large subunit ribosomal protein L10
MKSKGKKQEELDQLKKDLAEAKNFVVAEFKGITVAQDTDLRQKIRATNSKYRVVKNTLAKIATQGTPAEKLASALKGSTSIAYNNSDPVALAKALTAYAKVNPVFVFKAGMVEGRVVNLADLNAIAALPSKEELIAKVALPAECAGSAHRSRHERRCPQPCRRDRSGQSSRKSFRNSHYCLGERNVGKGSEQLSSRSKVCRCWRLPSSSRGLRRLSV